MSHPYYIVSTTFKLGSLECALLPRSTSTPSYNFFLSTINNNTLLRVFILLQNSTCYTVKCHLCIWRWVKILNNIFSPWKSSPNVVNATCQLLASVINASCSLPARVENALCQLVTRIDLEILNLARGFEKGLRIGSILDILDREFEESTLWIILSYP